MAKTGRVAVACLEVRIFCVYLCFLPIRRCSQGHGPRPGTQSLVVVVAVAVAWSLSPSVVVVVVVAWLSSSSFSPFSRIVSTP